MSEKQQIYKCTSCIRVVEVVEGGGSALMRCGEKMKLVTGNTGDAAARRHVPVLEPAEGGVKSTIGDSSHPMEEKHHINELKLLPMAGVSTISET